MRVEKSFFSPHKNLCQAQGLRVEFGSMNRERSHRTEAIRVRLGKGKQVGEIVENLVFEQLNECSESIHILEAIHVAWARLAYHH